MCLIRPGGRRKCRPMLLRSGRLLNRVQEQMIFACVRSDVPIEDRGTVKDTSRPEFWIEVDEADKEPHETF